MNILYMGTPDIAAIILKNLIHSRHQLIAIVTQPDKPKGRGNQIQFPPVKELALKHKIPVFQPTKVREENFLETVRQLNPDVIVVAAFGQLLPKALLDMPKYGCINVHASLLPKYRGAAPIQWAIIDGEEKTGITIMHMDVGLDTGDMIMKQEVIIEPKETGGSLHDKLAVCGGELLLRALDEIENGTAPREKQKEEESNYAKMLDKTMGNIDFNQSAVAIERFIRGLNPWPSAYTHLNEKTLKIWDADVDWETTDGVPGEILSVTKDSIMVKTGDGNLAIKELQLEGKKRMTTAVFLLGYSIETGTVLK
ncbi:MAG: methionyl-tRNA formyltransferase [Lachnospiraceae bacterium]|jgi:methionyl-tRNA formyltransferase|nr:methionyl-tRNA formyltransferase [Lachnospiraceae bacterium]